MKFLIFQVLLSLCILSVAAQGQRIADKAAVFDGYVRRALSLWKTPGMSIVVVKDGQVVFRKGFGVTEQGRAEPFRTGTMGVCASTTKAMTAVCIGMLVDEGKLHWTDKVRDVLPGFFLYDPYVSAELTVRDLLTHNAGLGNTDNLWIYGYTPAEIIRRLHQTPVAYPFHTSFVYQNCMYIVAGELIRAVSGLSWEDFITRRLFRKLDMNHTYPTYSRIGGESSLEGMHALDGDSVRVIPHLDYPNIDAAGGAWTCADDMDKWMLFMLDSARVNGSRLLKAETWSELFRPQTIIPGKEFYPTVKLTHSSWTTYGLGWFQEDYRGRMVQFHTGSLDGVVAIIGLVPSEHFGIYILANLDHSELRHALMYKAMDLWCFSDNSRDWSVECYDLYKQLKDEGRQKEKEKEAGRVRGTRPSLPYAAYAGDYTNEIYGDAHVVPAGDSLRIELPNDVHLSLQHWNYDTFAGYYNYFWWDKEWIQFSLDAEGKIARFTMNGVVYTPVKK
jgi:CubicO group peptidase (beta-lactamase class C family)